MKSKPFSFRAYERRALLKMLRQAGVADCEKTARRFEDCISSYRPSTKSTKLAITCCSRLLRLYAQIHHVYWDFDLLDEKLTKRPRNERDGKTLWETFGKTLATIDDEIVSRYLDYRESAWRGTKHRDRQFRRLCVALGEIWEEEIGSHFPKLKRTSPKKWASKGLPDHPLVLMLEAIDLFLDGSTMEDVLKYANISMTPWPGDLPDFMQESV